MSTLLERAQQTIVRHRMFERGDTVVVAVSGGPDSMALLHVLLVLREALGLTLHVAHLDHRLRPESTEDSAFVRQAAESLQLPVTVGSADVRTLAIQEKRSVEDAARRARYDFLAQVASDTGAAIVATAHTRNDQVETVLMRALDAAPWEMLAGIPPVRPVGTVRVVRPLLRVSRQDVLALLNTHGVAWRDDPTNRDLTIRRNWVRHVVIPVLERDIPGLIDLLARVGDTVRAADGALWNAAGQLFRAARTRTGDTVRLPLQVIHTAPPPVQRRLVRHALVEAMGTSPGVSRVVEDEALGLLLRRQPGEIRVGSWVVRRTYDALLVAPAPLPPPEEEYRLSIPGDVTATGFGVQIRAEILSPREVEAPEPGEAFLDSHVTGAVLRIRPWRAGDRFRPLGMKGKKKVQDLLVDQKVPRWERARIPLVVDARDRILWVVGQRISEDARVTRTTKRVVRLRVQPLGARVTTAPFA